MYNIYQEYNKYDNGLQNLFNLMSYNLVLRSRRNYEQAQGTQGNKK